MFGRTLLAKSCLLSHIWFPASVSLYDDARLDQLLRATAKFVHHRPLTIIVPARLGLTRDERRLAPPSSASVLLRCNLCLARRFAVRNIGQPFTRWGDKDLCSLHAVRTTA